MTKTVYFQNNKIHIIKNNFEYKQLLCGEELNEEFGYLLAFDSDRKLIYTKDFCKECWFQFFEGREPHGN